MPDLKSIPFNYMVKEFSVLVHRARETISDGEKNFKILSNFSLILSWLKAIERTGRYYPLYQVISEDSSLHDVICSS